MLFAACDRARYSLWGAKGFHYNCADNMRDALKPTGIDVGYVPTPLNLFMKTRSHNHAEMEVAEPQAKVGDNVIFCAEQDCSAVMSACPQNLIPVNAHGCMPQPVAYCVLE